ncbi:hypothetical protein GW17_00007535 [Ensete ventricosum]|nr:hypothetical protein GW17_00007535 [Ensete ventricosum]
MNHRIAPPRVMLGELRRSVNDVFHKAMAAENNSKPGQTRRSSIYSLLAGSSLLVSTSRSLSLDELTGTKEKGVGCVPLLEKREAEPSLDKVKSKRRSTLWVAFIRQARLAACRRVTLAKTHCRVTLVVTCLLAPAPLFLLLYGADKLFE